MINKSLLEEARFNQRLSLEEMSLIKIITTLCNDRDLCSLILKCKFRLDVRHRSDLKKETKWKAVEEKVNELISQICMPPLLQKKVLELLWPICNRIIMWNSIYGSYFRNNLEPHFYWTDRGRIDSVRTAKHILRNTNIPVTERFVFGSTLCLSEEMGEMWREMSIADKAYVRNGRKVTLLAVYWSKLAMGESCMNLQFVFRYAVQLGMLEAVKFIFARLPAHTKRKMGINALNSLLWKFGLTPFLEEHHYDVIYFLYFEMADDLQRVTFSNDVLLGFGLLFYASKYELCLRLLEERIHNVSNSDMFAVLQMILHTYHLELADGGNCTKLFCDVWRITPPSMRSYLASTDLGVVCPSLLIRDHFPFVLEKYSLQRIAELTSSNVNCSTPVAPQYDQRKWEFLHFFIEAKITTIPLLERRKRIVLKLLNKRIDDYVTLFYVLRFVNYISHKISQQKE